MFFMRTGIKYYTECDSILIISPRESILLMESEAPSHRLTMQEIIECNYSGCKQALEPWGK